MGRYKFPGKPTKHVNKKRVNVLLYTTLKNIDSITYNEYSEIHTNQVDSVDGATVNVRNGNSENDVSKDSCSKCSLTVNNNQKNEFTVMYNYKKYIMRSNTLTKTQTRTIKDMKRLIKRKKRMHDTTNKKFTPCTTRKSLYVRKRQLKESTNRINKFSSRIREREKNLVGKFVLPSKSLHSSRLIIPNKRFINNEQTYNTKKEKQTKLPKKKPLVNETKTNCKKVIETPVETETNQSNIITFPISFTSDDNKDINDMVVIDSSVNNNNIPRTSSKLVLRKARLQLNTQNTENMDCPFSNSTVAPSPPGTVTCGVCGAVRFYKFVKQARKFNIDSCESCRKFISKMIKRISSTKIVPKLACHKGQGMCHVPPIVRSQQWKLLRCAYKARCPACWLKMCLQSFQIPQPLKTNLIQMLPDNMQNIDEYKPQTNEINPLNLLPASFQPIKWRTTNIETPATDTSQDENIIPSGKLDILSSKTDTLLNKTKSLRSERPRSRLKKNTNIPNVETLNNVEYSTKRQKLDIKGPRVKHVCRSASIVLGQPLATFSNVCSSHNEETTTICEVPSDTDSCVKCKTLTQDEPNDKINDINEDTTTNSDLIPLINTEVCLPEPENTTNEECSLKPLITISSDYFDNYDSENKIYANGFGLIGSEPFSIQAVCFYCGSAGQEQLIYCACCCEPYHCYCINESITNRYFNNNIAAQNTNLNMNKKYLWKCSRCSICEICGFADNKKLICKLCQCYFHPQCMQQNIKYPMICSSCLNCEDCGSENVTDIINNSLLCLLCFKIRMEGKYCPICKNYDANFTSKMFKCGSCKYFVHTNCENLTNETYNLLNYLPDRNILTCSICSRDKSTSWRNTMNTALRNGYHIVLRLLIRSNKKWNLLKNDSICVCNKNYDSDVQVLIKSSNSEKSIYRSNISEDSKQNKTKQQKDTNLNISLRNMQKKVCIKECSVRIKNCMEAKEEKFKTKNIDNTYKNCDICNKNFIPNVLLQNIKKNINLNVYKNIEEFYFDVKKALKKCLHVELLSVFDTIIKDIFPWFNLNLYEFQETDIIFLNNTNFKQTEISTILKNNDNILSNKSRYEINTFDTRICVLCSKIGDCLASFEGRLLYCGQNEWIHVNCAFWSSNVYEELDCSFQNVHNAISRGRITDCSVCKEKGATLSCSYNNCKENYHYMCARASNCYFYVNKTIYCPSHPTINTLTIIQDDDFELQRPLYVNIDIQKKKYVELSKIQFLIGSLTVTSLGTFFPPFSDTEDAIIPSDFICTRLYWSTVEPWKIIKYNISTTIFIPSLKTNYESEKNFTIDHSLPIELIEEKIMEINKWNNDFEKFKQNEFQKDSINITDDDKIVLQVLDHLIELTCNNEDNCDDEAQNSTDILPPELKEAIFEDLPHDLLDGISMQDIFPKLMNYEDVITMDLKNPENSNNNNNNNNNSLGKDFNNTTNNLLNNKDDTFQNQKKDLFSNSNNDYWLDPKYSIQSLEDFVQNEKTISENSQQLKRSKSEVLTGIKKLTRSCNHQRSCSLTWSCKLDNTRSTTNIKKRKLCSTKTVADIRNNLFMLFDGNNEKCNIQESILMSVGHPATLDKVRELKYCLEEKTVINNQEIERIEEKENKCRMWRNRCQSRIVQTDGADDDDDDDDDSSSGSETESCDLKNDIVKSKLYSSGNKDEPVKCDRCQCTYRTLSSYKKHLENCDYISSSDSDSDISNDDTTTNILATVIKDSQIYADTSASQSSTNLVTNCDINTDLLISPMNMNKIKINNEQINKIINNVENSSTNIQHNVNKVLLEVQNPIQKITNNKKVPISKITSIQKLNKTDNNIPKMNIKRKIIDNKPINQSNHLLLINNTTAARLPEVNTTASTPPTVILQHVSSPNIMPAYVEAFQHQNNQNLQCIATIVPNDYKPSPTPFVTSNIFMPGAFQTTETTPNILNIPNTGFPVISGIDTSSLSSHPTIIGNLVNRPSTTFQCGLMSTEQQIVLGSIPNVNTIVNDPQGSLCYTSQPIYYGFETIVQNTVMSSQQFASSNLPGVLASNSSYSTTTTQVFHSSKLEPIMDLNNSGYLLLNSSIPQQVTTPLTLNPQPIIQPIQNKPNIITTTTHLPLIEPQQPYAIQIVPVCDPVVPPVVEQQPLIVTTEQKVQQPPEQQQQQQQQQTRVCNNKPKVDTLKQNDKYIKLLTPTCRNTSFTSTNSSITLPLTSNLNENKIPMNIVSPMPQISNAPQITKPTNRVLPMQAVSPQKEFQKTLLNTNKIQVDAPDILNKFTETVEKIQNETENIQSTKANKNKNQILKLESASLKLVFQKQSQDGLYKISNKIVSKNKPPTKQTTITKSEDILLNNTIQNEFNEKENQFQNITNNQQNNVINNNNIDSNIVYNVNSQDGFDYSSTSITELWKNVFDAVQTARTAHNMPNLPNNAFNVISGLQLLGLNSNGLRYLIEQLPGAGNCMKYKPVCHKRIKFCQYKEDDECSDTFRAARAEPYSFTKQPYDMFSWLASKHRNPDYFSHIDVDSASRRSSVNLPMAMRFRQLKETSKHAVGVYRSNIHGRGLFCLRDIECGEMVIEYAGEVIRSTLTDKREKYYNSKGIGCYMFRVDDNLVIDATMKGNAARFINHSCDPNCYSRVVDILGHKHILIFALRKIMQGEELTYDYKFPFEEDKIPCTCGAKRCRKYLN